MNAVWTLIAVAATLAAVGRLAAADPKRRRVFRLPPRADGGRPLFGWSLALAPGVLLAVLGTPADFVVWCGAATTGGWLLVALPPPLQQRLVAAVAAGVPRRPAGRMPVLAPAGRTLTRLLTVRRRAPPAAAPSAPAAGEDRIAALEARLAALEVEIAAARSRPPAAAPAPAADGEPRLHAVETPTAVRAGGPG